MGVVVEGEEEHLADRQLAQEGMGQADAVEVLLRPPPRSGDPAVHGALIHRDDLLTPSREIARQLFVGWRAPAGLPSGREPVAIVLPKLVKGTRQLGRCPEKQAWNQPRQTQRSCDGESRLREMP